MCKGECRRKDRDGGWGSSRKGVALRCRSYVRFAPSRLVCASLACRGGVGDEKSRGVLRVCVQLSRPGHASKTKHAQACAEHGPSLPHPHTPRRALQQATRPRMARGALSQNPFSGTSLSLEPAHDAICCASPRVQATHKMERVPRCAARLSVARARFTRKNGRVPLSVLLARPAWGVQCDPRVPCLAHTLR